MKYISKITAIILLLLLIALPKAVTTDSRIKIHDIQGKSHISKYNKEFVRNVYGVVTALIKRKRKLLGFYMQEYYPDNDERTSEGIFVFTRYAKVKVKDFVQVSGKVIEYARKRGHLSLTQIMAKYVKVIASNRRLPKPVLIGHGGRKIPVQIDSDGFKIFNPGKDAIDFYESMEGMLVTIKNPVVIAPPKRYGREIYVISDNGRGVRNRTRAGGVYITPNNYNANRLVISTELTRQWLGYLNTGDRYNAAVTGVLTYDDGMYKILALKKLPRRIRNRNRGQASRFRALHRLLTVATFNVKNLSAGNKKQINKIAKDIVYGLKSPDIIALQEIQDNNGTKGGASNRETDASATFKTLIAAIRKNRGPVYDYVDFKPDYPNSSGGVPGGNIRVGFLYIRGRVGFRRVVNSTSKGTVKVIKIPRGIKLSCNPGRIEPDNSAFNKCRKPLICEFIFRGQRIFIVNLHLLARGGDSPLFGSYQPPLRRSSEDRFKQAKIVSRFVKKLLLKNRNANLIVLGDFNDYPFSKTVKEIKKSGVHNLIDKIPGFTKYTYIHKGNAQVIDQYLVSLLMLRRFRGIQAVHFNTNLPEKRRSSDHDPVVAAFFF